MINNQTTELRRLLDERGVQWREGDASYTTEWTNASGQRCSAMYWKPTCSVLINNCTPEQAVAATLGSEKLTAEQVGETIERNIEKLCVLDDGKPVEWRDGWVCRVGIDYKAIADELNATLGSGTCDWRER